MTLAQKALASIATIKQELYTIFNRQRPSENTWSDTSARALSLRHALQDALRQSILEGLNTNDEEIAALARAETDILHGTDTEKWERIYTKTALYLGWNYLRGEGTEATLSYDGVSPLYDSRDKTTVASTLSRVTTAQDLQAWLSSFLPGTPEYGLLKDSLAAALPGKSIDASNRIRRALNDYRFIHHFHFDRLIVINIPSAALKYYADDTLQLSMKIVAGQPSKRTPRFAGWCDGLVLYPYWNVPERIIRQELFPLLKFNPGLANSMELQFIDKNDHVVDPSSIQWAEYTGTNFPYRIRQTPGCWNALGVLKFNLTDPFNVYMHDTNLKQIFEKDYRYYSHGCIRLERPISLGLALTNGQLDTAALLACYKDRRPVPLPLPKPVPVFVIYNTVGVDPADTLRWYKDIYHLHM
jgi:murein L,D-transpeptidase YcbB/YkuD